MASAAADARVAKPRRVRVLFRFSLNAILVGYCCELLLLSPLLFSKILSDDDAWPKEVIVMLFLSGFNVKIMNRGIVVTECWYILLDRYLLLACVIRMGSSVGR